MMDDIGASVRITIGVSQRSLDGVKWNPGSHVFDPILYAMTQA